MNWFLSYQHKGLGNAGNSVVRRYSDFEWLAKELAKNFPGIIIPPVPDKQAVGRFQDEFVESRRRSLEKFLIRIAIHEDLGDAQAFHTFLNADDAELSIAKEKSTKMVNDMTQQATSWFQTKMNVMTNPGGKAQLEKTATDLRIDDINTYMITLEKQLQAIYKHAEQVVVRTKEYALAMHEFGESVYSLGHSEGDGSGDLFRQIGAVIDRVSTETMTHGENEQINVEEALEEYVRLIGSVKAALTRRTEKRSIYVNVLTNLEVKQFEYNKLLSTPGKEDKASAKQQQLQQAQNAADKEKQEFEDISKQILLEVDAFSAKKVIDIKDIFYKLIQLENQICKKRIAIWEEIIPKFGGSAVPSTNNPFPAASAPPPVVPPSPPATATVVPPAVPTNTSRESDFGGDLLGSEVVDEVIDGDDNTYV